MQQLARDWLIIVLHQHVHDVIAELVGVQARLAQVFWSQSGFRCRMSSRTQRQGDQLCKHRGGITKLLTEDHDPDFSNMWITFEEALPRGCNGIGPGRSNHPCRGVAI